LTNFFIYPTECTTRLFSIKTYIIIYIKVLLHVSVNKPSSGSLLPCFAKVMIIEPYCSICFFNNFSLVFFTGVTQFCLLGLDNFHSRTVHPDIIKFFIYPTECTAKLIITLAKHGSKLPHDGLLTETCRIILM
jgi:hypothetical protein